MNNLVGQKFSKLTVIKRVENRNKKAYWLCKCECGIEKEIRGTSLKSGDSTSCGNGFCNGRINDITGRIFGKLTVLNFVKIVNGRSIFNCKCECGKNAEVEGHKLLQGSTVTCTKCNVNSYYTENTYMVGKTSKGELFYFDIKDFDCIQKINWWLVNGYVEGKINNKRIKIHRYLLNPSCDMVVDHIDGNPRNNRRNNLRICKQSQNTWNQKTRSDSFLGIKGIRLRPSGRYNARVQKDGQRYELGMFNTLKEAIIAYNEKAIELFGEYAQLNKIE